MKKVEISSDFDRTFNKNLQITQTKRERQRNRSCTYILNTLTDLSQRTTEQLLLLFK